MLAPIVADVSEIALAQLGLFPGRGLEPHRRLGLPGPPSGPHVGGHRYIAPFIPQTSNLPQRHPAILQSLGELINDN